MADNIEIMYGSVSMRYGSDTLLKERIGELFPYETVVGNSGSGTEPIDLKDLNVYMVVPTVANQSKKELLHLMSLPQVENYVQQFFQDGNDQGYGDGADGTINDPNSATIMLSSKIVNGTEKEKRQIKPILKVNRDHFSLDDGKLSHTAVFSEGYNPSSNTLDNPRDIDCRQEGFRIDQFGRVREIYKYNSDNAAGDAETLKGKTPEFFLNPSHQIEYVETIDFDNEPMGQNSDKYYHYTLGNDNFLYDNVIEIYRDLNDTRASQYIIKNAKVAFNLDFAINTSVSEGYQDFIVVRSHITNSSPIYIGYPVGNAMVLQPGDAFLICVTYGSNQNPNTQFYNSTTIQFVSYCGSRNVNGGRAWRAMYNQDTVKRDMLNGMPNIMLGSLSTEGSLTQVINVGDGNSINSSDAKYVTFLANKAIAIRDNETILSAQKSENIRVQNGLVSMCKESSEIHGRHYSELALRCYENEVLNAELHYNLVSSSDESQYVQGGTITFVIQVNNGTPIIVDSYVTTDVRNYENDEFNIPQIKESETEGFPQIKFIFEGDKSFIVSGIVTIQNETIIGG